MDDIVLVLRAQRGTRTPIRIEALMREPTFDHDRLDAYHLSIESVDLSFADTEELSGCHRHARGQWTRVAHSIPPNIAEVNGKRSFKDRSRFHDLARGSALECVAIQDVLAATPGLENNRHAELKRMLHRIVSMPTRLIERSDDVSESPAEYSDTIEYERRDAEYEYTSTKKRGNQNQDLHRRTACALFSVG